MLVISRSRTRPETLKGFKAPRPAVPVGRGGRRALSFHTFKRISHGLGTERVVY